MRTQNQGPDDVPPVQYPYGQGHPPNQPPAAYGQPAAAYAALEATEDVALAVACVAPLAALLGRPAEEIGAGELQRASLALAHLISLDCVAVGGEFFRDGRWLTVHSSEGNALNTILNKPTAELTTDCASKQP